MMMVKNFRGTSNDSVPNGFSSWLAWWEEQKGRRAQGCSAYGCYVLATDGAHVHKVGNNTLYILPLCHSCNMQNADTAFLVRAANLQRRH